MAMITEENTNCDLLFVVQWARVCDHGRDYKLWLTIWSAMSSCLWSWKRLQTVTFYLKCNEPCLWSRKRIQTVTYYLKCNEPVFVITEEITNCDFLFEVQWARVCDHGREYKPWLTTWSAMSPCLWSRKRLQTVTFYLKYNEPVFVITEENTNCDLLFEVQWACVCDHGRDYKLWLSIWSAMSLCLWSWKRIQTVTYYLKCNEPMFVITEEITNCDLLFEVQWARVCDHGREYKLWLTIWSAMSPCLWSRKILQTVTYYLKCNEPVFVITEEITHCGLLFEVQWACVCDHGRDYTLWLTIWSAMSLCLWSQKRLHTVTYYLKCNEPVFVITEEITHCDLLFEVQWARVCDHGRDYNLWLSWSKMILCLDGYMEEVTNCDLLEVQGSCVRDRGVEEVAHELTVAFLHQTKEVPAESVTILLQKSPHIVCHLQTQTDTDIHRQT